MNPGAIVGIVLGTLAAIAFLVVLIVRVMGGTAAAAHTANRDALSAAAAATHTPTAFLISTANRDALSAAIKGNGPVASSTNTTGASVPPSEFGFFPVKRKNRRKSRKSRKSH